MNIIGKSPQHSNVVFVSSKQDSMPALDVGTMYSLFPGDAARNSSLIDDAAMGFKIFSFPNHRVRIIQEQNRVRIEDISAKNPEESKIGEEAHRIIRALFPPRSFQSYGFNFDVYFRFDNVIPQREILSNFLSAEKLEDVRNFGWQFTIHPQKDDRKSTYFFKVISPIEIALHANVHHENGIPNSAEELQKACEKNYQDIDAIFDDLNF